MDAIRETPELSRFKFRVSNRWIEGTYNQAIVNSYSAKTGVPTPSNICSLVSLVV